MNLKPEISIIIPTYNRANLLGETLDSIIEQSFLNWECIVVDDGSLDHTLELLEFYIAKDNRISYHRRPSNRKKGANACRNYGFEISKGNYINWFDSDDLMHPDKLNLQLDMLSKSKLVFCVCHSLAFEDNTKKTLGNRFDNLISNNILYDYLRMDIGWLTQIPLWKKEFLSKLQMLFNEDLIAAQEWEFHSRVLSIVDSYEILEMPLVYNRKHQKSMTYGNDANFKDWHYYLARFEIYNNLSLDKKSNLFLRNYLVDYFKRSIVKRQLKRSLEIWFNFYSKEAQVPFFRRFSALLAVFNYYFFNRGNYFLQKIKH